MKIRAKLRVTSVKEHDWGARTVTLEAQYDPDIPEDRRFHQATPSGKLEMLVTNRAALVELKEGQDFYLDLIPVREAAAA